MMRNFRTFYFAVQFYRLAATLNIRGHLKEQLSRASASIALNLAEGRGKPTRKDQMRFFHIAMGSIRECQAILMLSNSEGTAAWSSLDSLAAHLYKLIEQA